MQAFSKFNRGIKYLLAVIDVFSIYGYLIPLKDKTGKSVALALKTIFKERQPKKMWVEKGKEFYNKDVKELIELYSTENEEKSSVVERWIRTIVVYKCGFWGKLFTPFYPIFTPLGPLFPNPDHFFCLKKHLKKHIFRDISYNSIIIT